MAASSIDILSFLTSLVPASSPSSKALSESGIFIDFCACFEDLITSGFFPVEKFAGLGGRSVEIQKKAYTVPSSVEKIHRALKSCILMAASATFNITPVLSKVNKKIDALKRPSPGPFSNPPKSLTILFYRKLADILNTCYRYDASKLDSQASLKTNLESLSAALCALCSVLETIKNLYQTLEKSEMQSQQDSVERVLVDTPQESTSLDLRGITGEAEWQAITYLLLFQDKDFQLTELDVTGLTATQKIEDALSIIRDVYPKVSIKGLPDAPSVTAAMDTPGVGVHAGGRTPPSSVSSENESICRIS